MGFRQHFSKTYKTKDLICDNEILTPIIRKTYYNDIGPHIRFKLEM